MPAILLELLGKILPNVISRVLPSEKISELDRANLQQAITLELLNQNWKTIEAEFADRANARNLASQDIAKGNAFTSLLAATVRPAWGFGALVLVGYSVFNSLPIQSTYADIVQTVLFFYFGGRTIEKITPTIAEAAKR